MIVVEGSVDGVVGIVGGSVGGGTVGGFVGGGAVGGFVGGANSQSFFTKIINKFYKLSKNLFCLALTKTSCSTRQTSSTLANQNPSGQR